MTVDELLQDPEIAKMVEEIEWIARLMEESKMKDSSILQVWKPFEWWMGHPNFGSWDGYRVSNKILSLHNWQINNETWFEPSLN